MIGPDEARDRDLGPFRGILMSAIPALLAWAVLAAAAFYVMVIR